YERLRTAPPSDQEALGEFATKARARIEALRERRGWNGHPPRWTSHTLDHDAREADKGQSAFRLEHFYETEYRDLCWQVHASGFVHRAIDEAAFPGLIALAFRHC